MKIGMCGSLESNDCLITVNESEKLIIEIKSIVGLFFKDQIEKVIKDYLDEVNIKCIKVIVVDKGALDCTILARLKTAISRMEKKDA